MDVALPEPKRQSCGGWAMTFEEILDQAIAMLQRRGRLTYGALKRQFQLDDAYLEDLKAELIEGQRLAVDEDGRVLVWSGGTDVAPTTTPPAPQSASPGPPRTTQAVHPPQTATPPAERRPPEAERRQLTVLFCDLVDSTALASQLDPEELREVVRAYQETCAKVIGRFEGHIAQYLGDGLLVYFGYPLAHEDDAQRAVRTGLGIVEALGQLNTRLEPERGVQLAVRLGIHTGLVVVGEIGGGTRHEQLALGETPNLAARLQGLAAPNTVVISASMFHLLGGFFACQPLGPHLLKGFAQPLQVYQVRSESTARSRLEAAGRTGLTPLVGREQEIGLLRERWAQVKDGLGQVVLLSGEAGIGKSRLVQVLTAQVATEPQAWLTPCQCSPYYQHTALYPFRAGGVFAAEAEQTGGVLGAVWPAAGGGRAALCRPPLPAAGRRLCAPDDVTRAAEAADLAGPADDPAADRRPAAPALRDGRPALGRSDHAGVAQPPR
jgi:class 3 adenylate cyclase